MMRLKDDDQLEAWREHLVWSLRQAAEAMDRLVAGALWTPYIRATAPGRARDPLAGRSRAEIEAHRGR